MRRLSFRQKLLITYASCSLALICIAVIAGSLYINSLQKTNVQDAVKMAEEQAATMAKAVREIMIAHNSQDFDDPAVQAGIRAVTRVNLRMNESLLWAAVISPNGDRFIEEVSEAGREAIIQREGTTLNTSEIPLPSGTELQVEVVAKPEKSTDVTMPIPIEGNLEGRIQLRVAESPFFKRIEESSQRITRALIWGSLLMMIFLLGIFYLLWRMFFKQLELQENNARLDRMAYVGTLASGLAHEIRNPLSSMNVNLEVIREELGDFKSDVATRTSELAFRVQREVGQLNSTLTNFLDFALPRKEGYSQFPLRGLVEELVAAHDEQLKAHEIILEIQSPPANSTIVEADRHLMHQAIRNVLVNAIQLLSGSVKKSIRITIQPMPKDKVRLSVADSGPGIAPENMTRIFEVFYSTRKGGSGFGLAIARKILEEHKGRLWAENNEDARGAVFIMELPCFAPYEEDSPAVKTRGETARLWPWQSRQL